MKSGINTGMPNPWISETNMDNWLDLLGIFLYFLQKLQYNSMMATGMNSENTKWYVDTIWSWIYTKRCWDSSDLSIDQIFTTIMYYFPSWILDNPPNKPHPYFNQSTATLHLINSSFIILNSSLFQIQYGDQNYIIRVSGRLHLLYKSKLEDWFWGSWNLKILLHVWIPAANKTIRAY